jgi:conjugal transfer pilus assembly protein TraU
VVSLLLLPAVGMAAESLKRECKDEFPNLWNDICWECMFPIRIGGKVVMKAKDMPDNVSDITGNADDYNPSQYSCTCDDQEGVPHIAVYISFWEPARILEVKAEQGCFSFLFGMDLSDALEAPRGTKGRAPVAPLNKTFQHVHYYSAPLLKILEIFDAADFCDDYLYTEFDVGHMTEVDPIWNDDEMTVLVSPEAALFANPISTALCAIADCPASAASFPLNALFWCGGCWGGLYPMTGNSGLVDSPVGTSSLLATRLLARLARMPVPPAVEMDTSSVIAKCAGQIRPFLKKSQYRMSMISPVPETQAGHVIGAPPIMWGEHRNIPATGEDHTYLLWRKRNCCLKILSGNSL